jgi:hypothetical protein
MSQAAPTVVPFRSAPRRRRDPHAFLDAVCSAGSLPVAAGDLETKMTAARLSVFGFVRIEEIGPAGARPLAASEAVRVTAARPWRVSRSASLSAFGSPLSGGSGRIGAIASAP